MTQTKESNGLGMSCLNVSNLEQIKHLLVDLLGFEMTEHAPEHNWMEFRGENGNCIGAGIPQDGMGKPGANATLSINVDDIEEARAFLESKGVTFTADTMEVPGHTKLAPFVDQDGNAFLLAEQLS